MSKNIKEKEKKNISGKRVKQENNSVLTKEEKLLNYILERETAMNTFNTTTGIIHKGSTTYNKCFSICQFSLVS